MEPWPQGKTERHDGIAYELVLALDAPVLQQTVEQLPNVVQFFATQLPVVAEPVVEVPKILPHDVPPRRLCRDTQLVEQLVEVPTIVSWSLLQWIMEQNVGIPVPGGGGRSAGLQGFLPGQSSTSLHGPQERISERNVEQIAVSRVGEGLQDFLPGQSSSSSSRDPARGFEALDEPGYGVFRTFPQNKKSATQPPHSGSELPPHSSPWTPAAYDVPWCSRRRRRRSPRTSLTFTSSTWSMMGTGGGASGSQLTSSTAGGWPLPMGPRLAILSGGLHGSSAAVQGDDATKVLLGWYLVRQWIHVPASSYLEVPISVHRQSGGFALLQRQVCTVSNCAKSSTTLLWRRGRFSGPVQQTTEISKLQSIDTVVVVVVQVLQFGYTPCGDSRDPTVAARFSGPCRSHARCVQRQMPMVDVLVQFIDGSHVPVITQRRLLSGSAPDSVIAGDSGHSSCATEMGT